MYVMSVSIFLSVCRLASRYRCLCVNSVQFCLLNQGYIEMRYWSKPTRILTRSRNLNQYNRFQANQSIGWSLVLSHRQELECLCSYLGTHLYCRPSQLHKLRTLQIIYMSGREGGGGGVDRWRRDEIGNNSLNKEQCRLNPENQKKRRPRKNVKKSDNRRRINR